MYDSPRSVSLQRIKVSTNAIKAISKPSKIPWPLVLHYVAIPFQNVLKEQATIPATRLSYQRMARWKVSIRHHPRSGQNFIRILECILPFRVAARFPKGQEPNKQDFTHHSQQRVAQSLSLMFTASTAKNGATGLHAFNKGTFLLHPPLQDRKPRRISAL